MKYYVYVLKSLVKKYRYIGMTNNLERRFFEHNCGKEKTTRPYKPFKLILVESYPNRDLAREREKYLKSGIGREFLDEMQFGR